MRRTVRTPRALVAVILGLALALPATAALAAAPAPSPSPTSTDSPILQYSGIAKIVDNDHRKETGTFTVHAVIDCSGSCALTAFTVHVKERKADHDLMGPTPIPLVSGSASATVPSLGEVCTDYWVGKGTLTIAATPTSATITRTGPDSGDVRCKNGSEEEWLGFTLTATMALDSGKGCLIAGDCPTPAPEPAVAASGPGFSAPSVLSALPTATTAITPRNALWAAGAALVLAILIAIPSHLLDTATEKFGDRIREWWARVRPPRRARAEPKPGSIQWATWPLAALGVLAAGVISVFVDPDVGFNGSTLRVLASILVSFLLDAVVGWFALILLVRRLRPQAPASFTFAPASLLVVAAAVLFTRLTGFQPGIVFGLVAGVAFGAALAAADRARTALLGLGYSFAVGVLAWIAYSVIAGVEGPTPGAGLVFVQETLSAMAVGGIAALPIALVPLRGLTGGEVFAWNRWVWGGAYAIGLVAFFLVLMPMPFSWQTVPLSLWAWIGIYAAYALVAVGLWLAAARPWRRESEDAVAAPDTPPMAEG